MKCCLALCLSALSVVALAEAKIVEAFEVTEPRSYAYQIGDTLKRKVRVTLRKPYELSNASLPEPKRYGRWLALTAFHYEMAETETTRTYDLDFTYQIINIVPELKTFLLPRHFLQFGKDKTLSQLEIPNSPQIGVASLSDPNSSNIQPNQRPEKLPQSFKPLLLSGLAFLLSILGLIWWFWGLPRGKKQRPFATALSRINKQPEISMAQALKHTHHAFNTTAGQTLFLSNLGDFFKQHAQFVPAKEQVNLFYAFSNQFFFDEGLYDSNGQEKEQNQEEQNQTTQRKSLTLADIKHLLRRCKRLERGV